MAQHFKDLVAWQNGDKTVHILLIALVVFLVASQVHAQAHTQPSWKPGTYKGLATGASSMKDVVRKLGAPKLKTLAETCDPTEWEWHYELQERNGTCCDLSFRKGKLTGITVELGEVAQSQAMQRFGGKFLKARFRADYARGCGGSSPLCEDRNGDQLLLLDPARGLYLWVESNGKVSSATFASTRPGIGRCRK
jgi:hypothetical protein